MAHLTIVTKRSPMSQWPIQRNVYTLVPQVSTAMNRSSPQETTHILTTHNTNTPRLTSAIHPTPPPAPFSSSSSLPSSTLTPFDDSLTNLSWLHDINILKRTMPTINSSSTSISNKRKEQSSPSSTSAAVYHPNDISDSSDLPVSHELDDDERWRMYKSNPQAKPIYSYSQLILLAMKRSGHEKMTLQMIYEWIVEHFPYFKKMEPTWQNSIRHNLSLNKYFIKVPRTKKEAGTGKGGFWKLSPDYERQRSLLHPQSSSSSISTAQHKRSRPSKRSSANSSLNQLISDNVTPLMKQSSRMSHENIKLESWIDPILPCIVSKSQSPLHCHTASSVDRCYVRMPSSFLSPTSSPDTQTVSPFHPRHMSDFSAILTPSPSNSPSSMSSGMMSKANFSSTKFDETDMLLLDSSTFDWDAYLCETPNDMDVQPLLTTKTEQDLFNDFNAALTDLTSAAAAANENDSNTFDAFDYANKSGSFHSLFDDDDHHPQQESLVQSSSTSLAVKGAGIKRPLWWMNNETNASTTKLPSLEAAFDLKLPK